MGKYTKIIDLYGLPGCGKTTLADIITSFSDGASVSIGRLPELTSYARKHPIQFLLTSISIDQFYLLFKLFFSFPILKIKDWRIYKGFIEFLLLYRYAKKVYVNDYIIVDHGFFQSVVSLTFGKVETVSDKSLQILGEILKEIGIDVPIYCKIKPEESLIRIRIRNRHSKTSRVDNNPDNRKLLNTLTIQSNMFESLYLVAKNNTNNSLILDMEHDTSSIVSQLLHNL